MLEYREYYSQDISSKSQNSQYHPTPLFYLMGGTKKNQRGDGIKGEDTKYTQDLAHNHKSKTPN